MSEPTKKRKAPEDETMYLYYSTDDELKDQDNELLVQNGLRYEVYYKQFGKGNRAFILVDIIGLSGPEHRIPSVSPLESAPADALEREIYDARLCWALSELSRKWRPHLLLARHLQQKNGIELDIIDFRYSDKLSFDFVFSKFRDPKDRNKHRRIYFEELQVLENMFAARDKLFGSKLLEAEFVFMNPLETADPVDPSPEALLHLKREADKSPRHHKVSNQATIDRIRSIIYYAYAQRSACNMQAMLVSGCSSTVSEQAEMPVSLLHADLSFDSAEPEESKECSPKQSILVYLLEKLRDHQYASVGLMVHEPVYTGPPEARTPTLAYRPVMPLKQFVHAAIKRQTEPRLWRLMINQHVDDIVTRLSEMNDPFYPTLVKCRYLYAFRDGLYVVHSDLSGLGLAPDPARAPFKDMFIPHGQQALPAGVSVAKFFDSDLKYEDFEDKKDWFDIKTPMLDKIMTDQFNKLGHDECKQVCRTYYWVIGRLLYESRALDKWQFWPFIKGVAHSGKSTIVKMCAHFYDPERVAVMTTQMEGVFAFSSFLNKDLIVGPEMAGKCNVSQQQIQSMISNETISVAEKNKTATSVEFRTPVILAGNETLSGTTFRDTSGSLARRFLFFNHSEPMGGGKSMNNLEDLLLEEMPRIILKCNRAYQEQCARFGEKEIWSPGVVPPYFHQQKVDYSTKSNSMLQFLLTDLVEFFPNLPDLASDNFPFVPLDALMALYQQWCTEQRIEREAINTDPDNCTCMIHLANIHREGAGVQVLAASHDWVRNRKFGNKSIPGKVVRGIRLKP